jgi:hypothetical protein
MSESLLQVVCPRAAGESDENYQLFLHFAIADSSLSEMVSEQVIGKGRKNVTLSQLKQIAGLYSWMQRRNLYRLELARKEESEADLVRSDIKKRLAKISEKVLGKIEEMVEFPVSEIVVTESVSIEPEMVGQTIRTTTIINPGDWNMGTIGRLLSGVATVQRAVEDPATMIRTLKKLGYEITLGGKDVVTAAEASAIVELMDAGESTESRASGSRQQRRLKGGD